METPELRHEEDSRWTHIPTRDGRPSLSGRSLYTRTEGPTPLLGAGRVLHRDAGQLTLATGLLVAEVCPGLSFNV